MNDSSTAPLGRSPRTATARPGRTTIMSPGSRLDNEQKKNAPQPTIVNYSEISLLSLCQSVVVANLERYPPTAFGMCCQDDFESLIVRRHNMTKPKATQGINKGGLDGTGRVAPAVSDRFIENVESSIPHFKESKIVDELVWKDCVEFRFKRDGVARPRTLILPWPLLVEQIANASNTLLKPSISIDSPNADEAYNILQQAPMNVALLKATGVGKTIKKALKRHQNNNATNNSGIKYQRLEELLDSWKQLAAQSGIEMTPEAKNTKKKKKKTPPSMKDSTANTTNNSDDNNDLMLLEKSGRSWRELFAVLKDREDKRRSKQGKRMREIRRNLACDRPKVVKVRPTPAKHSKILARFPEERKRKASLFSSSSPSSSASSPGKSKMLQLRKESSVVATRQRSDPAQPPKKSPSSFGSAVAFAACSKRTAVSSRNKTSQVRLAGGKQMKVPTKVVQGTAGGPRQMASKWKIRSPNPRR